jgi:hypothetical protein
VLTFAALSGPKRIVHASVRLGPFVAGRPLEGRVEAIAAVVEWPDLVKRKLGSS